MSRVDLRTIVEAELAIQQFVKAKQRRTTEPGLVWQPEAYQVPPDGGEWLYWALVAGRGTGKTKAGAHYVDRYLREHPRSRAGIIAPTLGDARATCVEGETGLLEANPSIHFNRSWGELMWPNGSRAQLFGAYGPDDVERLRGPQFHLVWCDEFAAWRQIAEAWDMMRLGLRLGERPHVIITTTPKPRKKLQDLLADPATVVARTADGRVPTTDDNPHLHPSVRAELYRQYGGTRLGRQELLAELLEDVEGAFWHLAWIDAARVKEPPQLHHVVVAIDPAATHGEDADETGIVVAGRGDDGHFYVIHGAGYRLSPHGWAKRALDLYDQFKADRIIAERNNGGEMVEETLRNVRGLAPVKTIVASRGKTVRAEPIAALYEQNRVHHVGAFPSLEDQMCQFPVSAELDDQVDALVYALTELSEMHTLIVQPLGVPRTERSRTAFDAQRMGYR
jgi:predicted phage terminase large subunit-like protein